MNKPVYICTGGCGAVIGQEQYDKGLKACGADGCKHKGHGFEKRLQCDSCADVFKEDEKHEC